MRTVSATPELIPFLLERMGPARVAAMRDHYLVNVEDGIANDIAASTLTWCGLDSAGVVNMGGIVPMPDGGGYVWQYVTNIADHKRSYLLQHREMLSRALEQYPRLVTIIEANYAAALRHAWRLGFAIGAPSDFNGTLGCVCIKDRDE